jgi:hypothetical protein
MATNGTNGSEAFFLDKPNDAVKPKLDFLSYSTRNERYNALIRLIVVLTVIIVAILYLMEKPQKMIYNTLSISLILIFVLCVSYYLFRTTKETYIPFTISPGDSPRNYVSPVYDARGSDPTDYGGITRESSNARRMTNPDLYVGIEPWDKEGRPVGIPDTDKTDLVYPTSATKLPEERDTRRNNYVTKRMKGQQGQQGQQTKEGFTFRSNTYDPPLGWGSLSGLSEEESSEEKPPEVKRKVINNYPETCCEERPMHLTDTTDLFPAVSAFKSGENPPDATEIPDLVPDRIFRGQIVQPSGLAGLTLSEIPINNRMGNVEGYPPQNSLLVQDGQNQATLFTFDRNDEDGRPISDVYESVNVGGKVYSPSSAMGGDPNRVGFYIEPGITQYNYRSPDTESWIGRPNFTMRSKIDMYDYQDPVHSERWPQLIKQPSYQDIKDQVIDQQQGDELLFRESMMNGLYMRRNMLDPLVRSSPMVRGAHYGGISSQ